MAALRDLLSNTPMEDVRQRRVMRRTPGTLVVTFLPGALLLASLGIVYAQPYPLAPVDPTYEDCGKLNAQYSEMRRQVMDRLFACMERPSHIGFARTCHGGRQTSAYPQCDTYELQLCPLNEMADEQQARCQERARDRAERERTAERDSSAKVAKQLKVGNDLYEKFDKMRSFIADPKTFLLEAFANQKTALDLVFPSGRFNQGLGDQLYRYAQNQAKAGYRLTPNPVVSQIQQSSLDALVAIHRDTMAQLDTALADFSAFSTDISRQYDARGAAPTSSSAASADPQCALFRDTDASLRLLSQDPERWEELNSKCDTAR